MALYRLTSEIVFLCNELGFLFSFPVFVPTMKVLHKFGNFGVCVYFEWEGIWFFSSLSSLSLPSPFPLCHARAPVVTSDSSWLLALRFLTHIFPINSGVSLLQACSPKTRQNPEQVFTSVLSALTSQPTVTWKSSDFWIRYCYLELIYFPSIQQQFFT